MKLFETSIDWPYVIMALIGCIYFAIIIALGIDPHFPQTHPLVYEIVSISILLFTLTTYEFWEFGLVVLVAGLPIRRIPWSKVVCATYHPPNTSNEINIQKAQVIITMHPGKLTNGRTDETRLFTNPFTTIKIKICVLQSEQCIELLRKFLGSTNVIV